MPPAMFVTLRAPLPVADMRHSCVVVSSSSSSSFLPASLRKNSDLPSGEYRGCDSPCFGVRVSCTGLPPFHGTAQMSLLDSSAFLSLRETMYATCSPEGENAGAETSASW